MTGLPTKARVRMRDVAHYGIGYTVSKMAVRTATLPALTLLAAIAGLTIATGTAIPALILVIAVVLCIIGGTVAVGWHMARTVPGERIAAWQRDIQEARRKARTAYSDMVDSRDPDWLKEFLGIGVILDDEAATDVGDDLSLRLRDLADAHAHALQAAGRANVERINRDAMEAAKALVQAAMAAHAQIDDRIRTVDETRVPDITRSFAQTARSIAGLKSIPTALPPPSASAALQRLIGLAEDALAVDPDLVDGQGARVDALVRQHLPRLLERHAEAARSATGGDLSRIDARLAEGVEQVRESIEEALHADASRRFDLLETEVRFLRMRRGSDPI